MKLSPKEVAIARMWKAQGHTDASIASVITLCRILDLEIEKFSGMQANIRYELGNLATYPIRAPESQDRPRGGEPR